MKFPLPKGTQLGWLKNRILELTSDIKGMKGSTPWYSVKNATEVSPTASIFHVSWPLREGRLHSIPNRGKKHFFFSFLFKQMEHYFKNPYTSESFPELLP